MSKEGHHIGKNAIWSVLNQTAGQLIVLVVFLVTARFISKEDFGTMAVAMLVAEVMRQLTIESIGTTLLARAKPDNKDYNAGFFLVIISSIAGTALVFLGATPFARLMDNPDLEHALHWICLIILTFGASKIHETWLAKNMQFKQLALRSIVCIFIGGGVGIYMAVHGYGLRSLIAQQIVTTLLGAVFLWSVTKWRPGLETTKDNILSLLKYSRFISFNNAANLANAQSDVFLSAYFLGAAPAGAYNAAKRLILSANLVLTSAIGQVSIPALSNASHDKEKLHKTYLDFSLFTSTFTAPAFMGIACVSQPLVAILLGPSWSEVAPVLSILCLSAYVISVGQLSGQLFLGLNKPHFTSVFSAINATSNVVVLMIFARYGLEYVALAFSLKTLFLFPIQLVFAHRLIQVGFSEYLKPLLPSLLASGIMGLAIYGILSLMPHLHAALQLTITIPAGFILYFLALWIIDRPSVKTIHAFINESMQKKKIA